VCIDKGRFKKMIQSAFLGRTDELSHQQKSCVWKKELLEIGFTARFQFIVCLYQKFFFSRANCSI